VGEIDKTCSNTAGNKPPIRQRVLYIAAEGRIILQIEFKD
jgi:hypothetical protein